MTHHVVAVRPGRGGHVTSYMGRIGELEKLSARSALPKLVEQMRGILQIHQPAWDEPSLCKTCSTRWPCEEARICGVDE